MVKRQHVDEGRKDWFHIEDIKNIFKEYVEQIHASLDNAMLEDIATNETIRTKVIERIVAHSLLHKFIYEAGGNDD